MSGMPPLSEDFIQRRLQLAKAIGKYPEAENMIYLKRA